MTELKTGRLPAILDRPALKLAEVLTGTVPDHPAQVDYLSIGGWQMLGNDRYGDCVAVTGANVRRLVNKGKRYPTMADVVAFYRTQNPGFPRDDNGMVIQLALEELTKSGDQFYDHVKAVAFAKVDHTNHEELKAAIAIFGYVWVGINVQQANMEQFRAGQDWDYVPGSPDEGGHSILVGAYDSDNTGADLKCVTWAKETGWTDAFWDHQVEEAWVVVWPEHLTDNAFLTGVDVRALADAYQAITGRPLPGPTPVPTPTPAPTPTPDPTPTPVLQPEDQALLSAAKDWLSHGHGGINKTFATEVQAWVEAKTQ